MLHPDMIESFARAFLYQAKAASVSHTDTLIQLGIQYPHLHHPHIDFHSSIAVVCITLGILCSEYCVMLKLFRLGVLVLLLPVLLNLPCVASEYIDNIGEAVSQIELDSYNKAAIAYTKSSFTEQWRPISTHSVSVIYLHTSKYADAEREFKESLNSREDWQIYYALGMVALAQGQRLKASDYFASARRLSGSEDELIGLDEYYHFVSTSKEPQVGRQEGDTPLARETYAMWAFRNEHYPTSATIFSEVLRNPAPLGFTEYRAPLVTFDPAHPIAFPKGVLTWKAPRITGVPSVSGDDHAQG